MSDAPAPRAQVSPGDPRSRLIFALDVGSPPEADALVASVSGSVVFFKVGLELWAGGGRSVAERLVRDGHEVFVDLKLHDIPETVARAVGVLSQLGARFVTVHGPPSAIQAAARSKGATQLLGVTVLTSMDLEEWRSSWGFGDGRSMADIVKDRARVLLDSGCDGLVCSPLEVAALRQAHPSALLVSPGVRPAGASAGDQKRVATPRAAMLAGADYLVVGRPIRDAQNPRAAADAIVAEMAAD